MTKLNFARLTWFLVRFVPRRRRKLFLWWFTTTFRRWRGNS